jgi:hypothetical protein
MLAALAAVLVAGCSGSKETPAPAAETAPEAATPAAEAAPDAAGATPAGAQAEPLQPSPEFRPETAAGAVPGTPAPTNTTPIVAVANYFTELPGIDIAALGGRQREKFLQQVNSEMCPCGCKNDTLARCYVNDPRCPTVKGMVQKLYDEVKSGK